MTHHVCPWLVGHLLSHRDPRKAMLRFVDSVFALAPPTSTVTRPYPLRDPSEWQDAWTKQTLVEML